MILSSLRLILMFMLVASQATINDLQLYNKAKND